MPALADVAVAPCYPHDPISFRFRSDAEESSPVITVLSMRDGALYFLSLRIVPLILVSATNFSKFLL